MERPGDRASIRRSLATADARLVRGQERHVDLHGMSAALAPACRSTRRFNLGLKDRPEHDMKVARLYFSMAANRKREIRKHVAVAKSVSYRRQ